VNDAELLMLLAYIAMLVLWYRCGDILENIASRSYRFRKSTTRPNTSWNHISHLVDSAWTGWADVGW